MEGATGISDRFKTDDNGFSNKRRDRYRDVPSFTVDSHTSS